MNRQQRRAEARTHRRAARTATALGSAAVLASAGAGAALVLASGSAGATGTTYVVNTTADTTDGTCDVADCSLRDAIDEANGNAGEDEITFSVTGTITLTSNLPVITDAVHINGPGAGSLTIDGDGAYSVFVFDHVYATDGTLEVTDLTVTHGEANTSYDEGTGGALMKFYGDADLTVDGVVFTANHAANDGGAIGLYGTTGNVVISNSVLSDNQAGEGGGGLYADGGEGADSGLIITITGTSVTGNVSYYDGGGLYLADATATITNSTIADNITYTGAGGIKADTVDLTVDHSTVSANTAYGDSGGGLYSNDSTVRITYSTISDNVTTVDGGGGVLTYGSGGLLLANSTVSGNRAYGYGGGLYLRTSGGSQIVNSTISGNTGIQGGGIYAGDAAGLAIAASTVTGNHAGVGPDGTPVAPTYLPAVDGIVVGNTVVLGAAAARHAERDGDRTNDKGEPRTRPAEEPVPAGTVFLISSIVAGNGSLDVGAYDEAPAVTVNSLDSLLGAVQPSFVTVNDAGGTQTGVTGEALKLGPLADNGGPTLTHALLPGSVAIDAGAGAADLPEFPGSEYDQRGEGYARIGGPRADAGAFEVQVTPEPTFTG